LVCIRHFKPECFLGNKLRKCSVPTEELGFDPIYLSVDHFEQNKISNDGVGYGREIISKDSDAEIMRNESHEAEILHYDENEAKIMRNESHEAEILHNDENEAEIMRNESHEAEILHYDENENIEKDNLQKKENIRLKKENSALKKQIKFWKNRSRRLGLENASFKRVFSKNIACGK